MKNFLRINVARLFVGAIIGTIICVFLATMPFKPTKSMQEYYRTLALDMYENDDYSLDYPLHCSVTFNGYVDTVFTIFDQGKPFTAGITFKFYEGDLVHCSYGFNESYFDVFLQIWICCLLIITMVVDLFYIVALLIDHCYTKSIRKKYRRIC